MCCARGRPGGGRSRVHRLGRRAEPRVLVHGTGSRSRPHGTAITELLAYLRELPERRSRAPADDLMTALIRAEDDGDRLTRDETVTMVANLLVGGHDTTASQIGCTLLTLAAPGRARWRRCRRSPALLARLVSETIRVEPSIIGALRTVAEPIEDTCGLARSVGLMVCAPSSPRIAAPRCGAIRTRSVPRRFEELRCPAAAVVRRRSALLPGRRAGADDVRGDGTRCGRAVADARHRSRQHRMVSGARS